MALIVTQANSAINETALKDWANARLGKTQRLCALEFREILPRGTLDKVLKNILREPYWIDHGTSV